MVKAKIMVIADAPLVTGFRLAGLEDCILTNEENFQKDLENALAKPEYGILVVNELMMNSIDWRLKRKLDTLAYPVIIPMPDVSGESSEGEEIRSLIKRALGFDLAAKT
jgi:vacuolar-type H+-ATPase subunit F/Vma7